MLSRIQKIFLKDNNCRICCAILCLVANVLCFLSAVYFVLLLFVIVVVVVVAENVHTFLVLASADANSFSFCRNAVYACVFLCMCAVPRLPSLVRIFIGIVILALHWYRFHSELFRCFIVVSTFYR